MRPRVSSASIARLPRRRSYTTGSDPVGLGRRAFDAFARGDVDAVIRMGRSDITLRDHRSSGRSGLSRSVSRRGGCQGLCSRRGRSLEGTEADTHSVSGLRPSGLRVRTRRCRRRHGTPNPGDRRPLGLVGARRSGRLRRGLPTPRRDPPRGSGRASSTSAPANRSGVIKSPRKLGAGSMCGSRALICPRA
jgi:hypothetical protein